MIFCFQVVVLLQLDSKRWGIKISDYYFSLASMGNIARNVKFPQRQEVKRYVATRQVRHLILLLAAR